MDIKKYIIYGFLTVSGIATGSALLYYIYKTSTKVQLSEFINEYFTEANEKLSNDPNLSNDTICYIVNLFNELEDYLFNYYFNDLNEERYKLLKNKQPKNYEKLLLLSISNHQETIAQSRSLIEQKLKIKMNDIEEGYKSIPKETLGTLMRKCKKLHIIKSSDFNKDIVKKAYKEWCALNREREEIACNLFFLSINNTQYENFSTKSYLFNKYYVKDKLYCEYHIKEQFIDDLIDHFGLDEDEEIIQLRKEADTHIFN